MRKVTRLFLSTILSTASLISVVGLSGCKKKEKDVIDTAPKFLAEYVDDEAYTTNFSLDETITLTNPSNNQTVTIPATVSFDFDQTGGSSNATGEISVHGTGARTLIQSATTDQFESEIYVSITDSNNGKKKYTTYFKEDQTAITGTVSEGSWAKSTDSELTKALLSLRKISSDTFNDDATYEEDDDGNVTITGKLLQGLEYSEVKSMIDIAGISGLEVQTLDYPEYDPNNDTNVELQRADIVYSFNSNWQLASIYADEFTVTGSAFMNGQLLNMSVVISLGATFSNYNDIGYEDTVIPQTVQTITEDSANINDLFAEDTPIPEATAVVTEETTETVETEEPTETSSADSEEADESGLEDGTGTEPSE